MKRRGGGEGEGETGVGVGARENESDQLKGRLQSLWYAVWRTLTFSPPSPSYYVSLSILMFYLRGKNATSPKFASQLARILWFVPPTEFHVIFFLMAFQVLLSLEE